MAVYYDTTNQNQLYGGGQSDTFFGLGGKDTIIGRGADDTIFGGAGADSLEGNNGSDQIYGEGGDDTLDGGIGADYLNGGAGNDLYVVDNEFDVIQDSGGRDTVWSRIDLRLADGLENLVLKSQAIAGYGNGGANQIVGNGQANDLFGDGGSDELIGGAGNDEMSGGTGSDIMDGGAGDDTYFVDHRGDRVLDSGGNDTVWTTIDYTLPSAIEDLSLDGGAGAIDGTGNDRANYLDGNESSNRLHGLGGADHIFAREGDDHLYGGDGGDLLTGWSGDDHVYGGAGSDVIYGDSGSDGLYGGAGDDDFEFENGEDGDIDTIWDFTTGRDEVFIYSVEYGGGVTLEISLVDLYGNANLDSTEIKINGTGITSYIYLRGNMTADLGSDIILA